MFNVNGDLTILSSKNPEKYGNGNLNVQKTITSNRSNQRLLQIELQEDYNINPIDAKYYYFITTKKRKIILPDAPEEGWSVEVHNSQESESSIEVYNHKKEILITLSINTSQRFLLINKKSINWSLSQTHLPSKDQPIIQKNKYFMACNITDIDIIEKTSITWDTIIYQNKNAFEINSDMDKIVLLQSGIYKITINIATQKINNELPSTSEAYLTKNDKEIKISHCYLYNRSASHGNVSASIDIIEECNENDYIKVIVLKTSKNDDKIKTIGNGTRIIIEKIL